MLERSVNGAGESTRATLLPKKTFRIFMSYKNIQPISNRAREKSHHNTLYLPIQGGRSVYYLAVGPLEKSLAHAAHTHTQTGRLWFICVCGVFLYVRVIDDAGSLCKKHW